MNYISEKIIKFRKEIVIFFLILTVVMGLCMSKVKINYNMQDYLPEDANSTKAIEIMTENFDDSISNANVLVSDITINEALDLKNEIKEIDGVENITWLDKVVDLNSISNEEEFLNSDLKETIEKYYKDKNALFQITIESGKEKDTVNSIYEIVGAECAMNGSAVEQASAQNLAMEQSVKSIMLIAPIIIIILVLSTKSWIEPFLYLTSIGSAVAINLGLCLIQGEISYVTLAVAPLLQLAVSLDYAVFLSHSFDKYKGQNKDIKDSMKLAMKDSLKSISASCLTTLFGFVALLFMDFKIGPDMGIALVRGVALSFISVMVFLPALILCTNKLNDKFKHKSLLPNFKGLSKIIVKSRIPVLILLSTLIIGSYNLQGNNTYIYGSGEPDEGSTLALDTEKIEETFGKNNMIAILVPIGNEEAEINLGNDLEKLDFTENVISYMTTVGPNIPKNMVQDNTLKNFYSDKYARIVVTTTLDNEGDEAFNSIKEVQNIVYEYYDKDDVYMCGNTVNMYDMKNTVENDNKKVSIITLIAIFVILFIEFKSIIIPVILILGVKGSIWMTMALSSMAGSPICYIGYLVVSTVMMGATIDYSILITDNYIKNRKTMLPKEAMTETLSSSIKSILVSAITLAFAGFALGLSSGEGIVKSLGLMLGKGTVISFIVSITLLPAILIILDSTLPKLSLGLDFKKKEKEKKILKYA